MTRPILLLVEDNADDEALVRRAMRVQAIDARLTVVRDGDAALRLLQAPEPAQRCTPALVLLDLDIPQVHGLEVLRRVRADPLTRALPVVILTASTREADRVQARTLGADGYERKPTHFPDLVALLDELSQRWLAAPRAREAGDV